MRYRPTQKDSPLFPLAGPLLLVAGMLVLVGWIWHTYSAYDSATETKNYLESSGFSSVAIGETHFTLMCGHGRLSSTEFKAVNQNGWTVEGLACGGPITGMILKFH